MDYESFKEKFVEDLKDRLDDQGADVKVSVNTVNKLNESYEAVTVTPQGSNIGVNIGIDKFYNAMENGRSYDEVVDKAVEVVNNGITQRPDFDIDSLSDYSQMKKKLAMEVVSAEANKEMLETVPHQNMEDMAVVYRFVLNSVDVPCSAPMQDALDNGWKPHTERINQSTVNESWSRNGGGHTVYHKIFINICTEWGEPVGKEIF